jgi:hypothetical protein
VVSTEHTCAKTTFSEEFFDFIAVAHVIMIDDLVVALIVIVTVIFTRMGVSLPLLGSWCSDEIDNGIV